MDQTQERSRLVCWDKQVPPDPSTSGLDGLRAMAAGSRPAPPVGALLGMRVAGVEPGRVRMALAPAEFHYNPIGTVHGGVIATLLDTVVACAVLSTLPAGRACLTLEIKVNYVRALTEAAGEVIGEGVAVHTGRQVGVAEGRVTDAKGRLYATASTTLLVFDQPPPRPQADDVVRERLLRWEDPLPAARAGAAMAGIDYLRAIADGSLPRAPIAATIGMGMGEIAPGRVSMTLQPGEHLTNPGGSMHGGMIATLLDSVLGCAVHSTIPVGRGYTTLELKVNYIRAITAASGLITGMGEVVHAGRQVAVAEARAVDAAGHLCATASTTCLTFDRP